MVGQHMTEVIMLAGKAIRGTLDFRGRSTRLEVMAFWLAVMFVGIPLASLFRLLEHGPGQLAATIGGYLVCAPFAALLVRRLHDLDHSGWWAVAPIPVVLVNAYQSALVSFETAPQPMPMWVSLALLIPIGLTLTFVIAPGTEGRNRFGPDPRRSIDPEQLRARDQQDEAEGAQDPLLG